MRRSLFLLILVMGMWPAAAVHAAGEPKEMKRYPTSHELNDPAALADRALWLEREIGIASVAPELRRIVK
jgi:hypothetical protein